MAVLKTRPRTASVAAFLGAIKDDVRRKDSRTVAAIMRRATKARPRLWGSSIVGFGDFHYKYASGREGDWFLTGFAPRKDRLTLYLWRLDMLKPQLARLGKHTKGKGCLHIRKLADIDVRVLQEMIEETVRDMKASPATHA
jgi:Domain of unknown function (DU1801)